MSMSGVTTTGTNRSTTTERMVEAKKATTIHFSVFLMNFNFVRI
jgi:hypothetical protein